MEKLEKLILAVGQHVWIKESDCCGGYHQKGEEGIIISAGTPDSFLVDQLKLAKSIGMDSNVS